MPPCVFRELLTGMWEQRQRVAWMQWWHAFVSHGNQGMTMQYVSTRLLPTAMRHYRRELCCYYLAEVNRAAFLLKGVKNSKRAGTGDSSLETLAEGYGPSALGCAAATRGSSHCSTAIVVVAMSVRTAARSNITNGVCAGIIPCQFVARVDVTNCKERCHRHRQPSNPDNFEG